MKFKRLSLLMILLFLIGSTTLLASSMWGEFKDHSKIRLLLNNEVISYGEDSVPAFLIENEPVVPAEAISEHLQALVDWNRTEKTLSIYKPNVHMFVARAVTGKEGKEGIDYTMRSPFGKVEKGEKLEFSVFAQVDHLKTQINSFKMTIETPAGELAAEPHEYELPDYQENFFYLAPFHVTFDETGPYKVKFAIKMDEKSDFVTVSEKIIVSSGK